ncbi:MAG: phosphoribosylformylglycinamidine synthase subunit PurQ [Acidimicrobiia bacterium]|nr:MAG: phosphoribosylformylglycinamidine synthase subunit PurQ [Acidimicrobiia bacterium]
MSPVTAVVVFPGTNCERDVIRALRALGGEAEAVWHRDADLSGFAGVVLPGGFAHGDYLRPGAIAATSPIMAAVRRMAGEGRPVLGICNGWQVLCEAGLLPGAHIANRDLRFICRFVEVEVVDTDTVLTSTLQVGQVLRIPLNSYEGAWVDPSGEGRVVLRYRDDPNGSQGRAAAVADGRGNVVGVMPHPERAVDHLTGSTDGVPLLESYLAALERLPVHA